MNEYLEAVTTWTCNRLIYTGHFMLTAKAVVVINCAVVNGTNYYTTVFPRMGRHSHSTVQYTSVQYCMMFVS